jgi:probable F420-dependent oxidoreductase
MNAMRHRFRFGLGPAGLLNLTTAGAWRDFVRRAEDLGYEAVCLGDHIDGRPSPGHAAVAVAHWTTTLRAAIHILNNDLRHPPVLARELCTIAMLTEGRFDAGIGAGWMRADYDHVGLAFDPPGQRIARLDEAAQIVRQAFTQETVSFAGAHFHANEMLGRALLGDAPRPRLVMGGGGSKMLAVAAAHADIVSVNVRLESGSLGPERGATATRAMTHQKLDVIRRAAGIRFDELILQVEQHVIDVTDDRDAALARAATTLNLPPDETAASPHVLVGSVSEIVDRLLQMREDFGFSYICCTGAAAESFAPVVARLAGT